MPPFSVHLARRPSWTNVKTKNIMRPDRGDNFREIFLEMRDAPARTRKTARCAADGMATQRRCY
ncbi:MAG: hypothetical protein CTY31_12100 [Hyphomicrobium sp.]|nr:MAG: hypothetical protein CTY39_02875 [Hyphomicrobium sp.]PPC98765.1 MAG: hypothetical protein CTY31_12100 [Hyphomicrobium sp.]